MCNMLDSDDQVEIWLARLGAEISYQVTGDIEMKRELQAAVAPGNSHILPAWSVAAARDMNKAVFLQQGRIRAGYGKGGGGALPPQYQQQDDDDGQPNGAPRRRARPKKKGPKAAQAAGGQNS